jgi:hypothetical protein
MRPFVLTLSAGLVAGLVAGLLAACSSGDPAASAIVVRDSSGVAIIDNDLTRLDATCTIGASPTVSIGVEEGEEPYVLARLGGALRLPDGRIVIANRGSHELRWFDASGTYLRASGRKGEGPGEFRDPFYLHLLPGDTVYAGDFRPFRFLVFTPEGDWVRTIDLSPMRINTPRSMHILDGGRMVLGIEGDLPRRQGRVFTANSFALTMSDATGTLGDTIATIENGRWGQTTDGDNQMYVFPIFEAFGQAAASGQRIVTGHASRTELRVLHADAGYPVERLVRWTVGNLDITPEDVAAEKARLAKQYEQVPENMRAMMLEPLITDARPVADRFPAFGSLRIGRDGRLWVREFPRPRDATGHHWIAFTAEGRFDCRLDTPRFAEVYEFGADYVLVQDPDSLGVERVRQFPLSRD